MGCASSKEAKCNQCKRPYSFNFRSTHSSPFHRRSSRHRRGGDTNSEPAHTYSQRLSDSQLAFSPVSNASGSPGNIQILMEEREKEKKKKNVASRMSTGSRQWKPITQARTSSGEAETINTWELMEGLEEHHTPVEDFSFPVPVNSRNKSPSQAPVDIKNKTVVVEEENPVPVEEEKPMWLHMAGNESTSAPNAKSLISDFDPDIISTFRKALEELSPSHALLLRSPGSGRVPSHPGHHKMISQDSNDQFFASPAHSRLFSKDSIEDDIPVSRSSVCDENKIVLYFTSLRGIRKTYEDCCNVRVILNGLGVKVDERDVSMNFGFRDELRQLLGTEGLLGKLPRVFVKGKYVGGAEEIRRMHEDGKLEKVIQGCEMVDEKTGNGVCESCGDIRFVPCDMCSGSCKIYIEEIENGGGDEDEGVTIGGFHRCPYCNENGIVRCPTCC
ncbi:hypothetical protein ACHQM5_008167 [Ranunculus cassubicifolius]